MHIIREYHRDRECLNYKVVDTNTDFGYTILLAFANKDFSKDANAPIISFIDWSEQTNFEDIKILGNGKTMLSVHKKYV